MFADWAKETTTTTGTGNITLAAASGYPRISAVVGLNKMFSYGVLDDSTGAPIESGIGYLSDANTLVRSKIVETMVSGTFDNTSPTAVTLAAGSKRVICAPLARTIDQVLPLIGNTNGNKFILNDCLNTQSNIAGAYPLDLSGRLNVHPWKHPYGGEIDGFSVYVSTAQAATILRIGLYSVGINGLPNKLIVEGSSSIDLAATGNKVTTFTPQVLAPGWYYIGLLMTATTAVLSGSAQTSGEAITKACPWGVGNDMNAGFGGYATGQSTSSFPETCPGLTFTLNMKVPGVAIRAV